MGKYRTNLNKVDYKELEHDIEYEKSMEGEVFYYKEDVDDLLNDIENRVNTILSKLKGIRTIDDLSDIIEAYDDLKVLSDDMS